MSVSFEKLADAGFSLAWKSLPGKPSTTIRCFDRGDFFTVHYEDAIFVANQFFKSPSVIRYVKVDSSSIPCVKINKKDPDFFRFILLVKQYRSEIYVSNTRSGHDKEWNLSAQASPGNLTEMDEYLYSSCDKSEDSTLLAIIVNTINEDCMVYLAFCNLEDHQLVVGEFADSPLLPNLETAILQLGARECLIPSGLLNVNEPGKSSSRRQSKSSGLPFLQLILERSDVLITELKRSEYFTTNASDDLDFFLKDDKSHASASSLPNLYRTKSELRESFQCLGAILKFLKLKSNELFSHAFSLTRFSLENFVRLDSAALRALHLLPSSETTNKYHSVFGVLNHCRTPQGQRLLAQWLRQPLTDVGRINERLNLVETFVEDSNLRHSFHETFLRRVPDLPRLARRLQMSKAKLQDVYRVYRVATILPSGLNLLRQHSGRHIATLEHCLITPLQLAEQNFSKYCEMVESTLDLDAAKLNEFVIRADFDDELQKIKDRMTQTEAKIGKEFRHVAQEIGLEAGKTIKLEITEGLGYHLRVTLKMEKHVRGLSWLKKIDMQKSGVRFRSSNLSILNDQFTELKTDYENAQKVIVKEILNVAAGYLEPLYSLGATSAYLDVVVSLATAAVSAPNQYVRPRFVTDGRRRICMKDARHPCLEMQEGVSVIPNDVHLERGKCIFKTITGPNMGGKSTYIRGTGVLVAMAQAGSFIPCSEAEMVPVDAIMARVGAADCQLQGVSTFMAEMLETVAVLRSATHDSLVIIDELGRGTSTYDGFGLAWAISSHLASEVACFTLFATHFHELTSMALIMPNTISNYRVAAHVISEGAKDADSVVMLYKVEPGICDQSYGLQVARSIGLPADLIADAEVASLKEEKLESMWVRLEERSLRAEPMDDDVTEGSGANFPVDSLNALVVAERLRTGLIECLSEDRAPIGFASSLFTSVKSMLDAEFSSSPDCLHVKQLLEEISA